MEGLSLGRREGGGERERERERAECTTHKNKNEVKNETTSTDIQLVTSFCDNISVLSIRKTPKQSLSH